MSLLRHTVLARKLGTPLLAFGLAARTKPVSGTGSSDSAPSDSAASSGPPTLAPPPDAARSCTPTLTGKLVPSPAGEPGLEYEVKNTGTHAWHSCQIFVFGYDPSGTRVSWAGVPRLRDVSLLDELSLRRWHRSCSRRVHADEFRGEKFPKRAC